MAVVHHGPSKLHYSMMRARCSREATILSSGRATMAIAPVCHN